MSTLKSVVYASVATLAPIGVASAADLPFRKAAPVEYMRVCDAFGSGFFYIPGTDTCLRVSGQIRAEATVRGGAPTDNPASFARNLAGQVFRRDTTVFRARGYLNADARTQTAYGAIRTYVSFRITNDTTPSGPSGGGSFTPAGAAFSQKTSIFQGLNNPSSILDKGFIQFAGFTAGRVQSFYDFDAQSYELLTNSIGNSNQTSTAFAYTATFGKGFSATISAEDPGDRSIGDNGFVAANNNPTATKAGYLAYGGTGAPDVVGNLRYEGDWGSAQLSAAYHEVSSIPVTLANGVTVTPATEAGFALLGGVKFLLPMLAKSDSITIQGSYEQGAMDYINPLNYYNGLSNVYDNDTSISVPVNDAFVRPNGRIALNEGFAIYAAMRHYWIDTVYSSLYGDYTEIHNPRSAQLLSVGNDSARIYQIGFNTIWAPIKDFQVGGEVLYTNMHLYGAAVITGLPRTPLADSDDIRGRFSVRRSF